MRSTSATQRVRVVLAAFVCRTRLGPRPGSPVPLIKQCLQLSRLYAENCADVHDGEEGRFFDVSALDGSEGGVGDPRSPGHLDLRQARLGPCLSKHPPKPVGFGEVPAELARLPRHAMILC